MGRHRFFRRSVRVLLPALLPWLAAPLFGCATSDSVGDTFQNLGGAGGYGTGGSGDGGATLSTSDTSSSTTSSTSTSSTSTTSTSTSGTTTTTSTTTEPTCMDGPNEGEPNNSEATATNLGTIGDPDGQGSSISGVLNGPGDVDWFRYYGLDDGGITDPSRTLTAMGAVRLCKFMQCDNPPQDPYVCPGGSTPATSPDGRLGCCSFDEISYSPIPFSAEEFDCNTGDDSAYIYIRVDNPNQLSCVPYTVDYHF